MDEDTLYVLTMAIVLTMVVSTLMLGLTAFKVWENNVFVGEHPEVKELMDVMLVNVSGYSGMVLCCGQGEGYSALTCTPQAVASCDPENIKDIGTGVIFQSNAHIFSLVFGVIIGLGVLAGVKSDKPGFVIMLLGVLSFGFTGYIWFTPLL